MKNIASGCFTCIALLFAWVTTGHGQHSSDPKALKLAEKVIQAMGGMDNWNETRYLRWEFFDSRLWWWDKWTGNVRCEVSASDLRIAMNVHDKSGNVYMHGSVQTSPDTLEKYLDRGYRMWINDMYWLVMPFKLKDPGVTLKHLGDRVSVQGTECEVLELTFEGVGVTPDNKYHVYVDKQSHLVVQWDYYTHYNDDEPRFRSTWDEYARYDGIRLSAKRGDRTLDKIAVIPDLPEAMFRDVQHSAEYILTH